jgi:hypothetical protein
MKLKLPHLFLFIAVFFVAEGHAQVDRRIGTQQYKRKGSKEKPDYVQQTVDYYTKELKLDDFQVAAVREILEDEKEVLTGLMKDQDTPLAERKDKVKAINQRIDTKILPLLSEQQQNKYKELRKINDETVDLEPESKDK